MIAQFPNFSPITLDIKDDVQAFVARFEPYSDFNFVSMFAWGDTVHSGVSILNGNLVMRLPDYMSDAVVYSIIGDTRATESVEALRQITPRLDLVPAVFINALGGNYKIAEQRGDFDYVYTIDDLVSLPGGAYKKIRNKVHAIEKDFGERTRVTFSDAPNIYELCGAFEQWARSTSQEPGEVKRERAAIYKALVASSDIRLVVAELYVDGVLCGFSINELLTDGYAICHFEKVLKKHPYLSTYLIHEVAKELQKQGSILVNWEQDLDIEGLRQSKLSYHPNKLLKKYSVVL